MTFFIALTRSWFRAEALTGGAVVPLATAVAPTVAAAAPPAVSAACLTTPPLADAVPAVDALELGVATLGSCFFMGISWLPKPALTVPLALVSPAVPAPPAAAVADDDSPIGDEDADDDKFKLAEPVVAGATAKAVALAVSRASAPAPALNNSMYVIRYPVLTSVVK